MKSLTITILLFLTVRIAMGQETLSGSIEVGHLHSPLLENPAGENPTRRVSVYLPPDYDKSTENFPVIYYLHGFTWSDSLQMAVDRFDLLMDKAIQTGMIKPVIVVMPDHHTLYRGSFYTNSEWTGRWADFTAIDLVAYIDEKYRTIADKEGRGIAGHSMGGYGAIKIGMQFPEVFSSVYALSPAALGLSEELGVKGSAYKRIGELDSREQLVTGYAEFYANGLVALGQAFSPNPNSPPFFADYPYTYVGDSLIVNHQTLQLWKENLPIDMIDDYLENLNKLKALKFDWGRNDENLHIPETCRIFSQKLENHGIDHYAEEYLGNHGNKLWTDDGRAMNDMLPFFNTFLVFED